MYSLLLLKVGLFFPFPNSITFLNVRNNFRNHKSQKTKLMFLVVQAEEANVKMLIIDVFNLRVIADHLRLTCKTG